MDLQAPLFRILDLQHGAVVSCILEIQADHPILSGHFPGKPVVPGACIIRAIHEVVELATGRRLLMAEAPQIKFLQPLLPQIYTRAALQLTIEALEGPVWKVSATLSREEQIFTKFRGTFRES